PGAFQYIADRIITPAKEKNAQNDLGDTVSVYLDDICIGGDNVTQMMQRLEAL
ncbi:Ubiquitin-conjugating enzyme E2 W, partial [Frankliniella fusca]